MTSFVEHHCTLEVPGWKIPAALTLPAAPASPLPSAIVLVPGSLFSDVNGDYPEWKSHPRTFAWLAEKLTALGHAVYRFAKLGPGTGSLPVPADRPVSRGWAGRLDIAAGALTAMQRELRARGVRVERMVAAGHSEGSVVVSQLAVSQRARELDGVALLAGPSAGILTIMREQQIPQARVDAMPEEAKQYLRDCDATDPLELARRIALPTLVVQGGNDTSVAPHHGERLRAALGPRGTWLFVPGVTHTFKVVPEGLQPAELFGYPGPTDDRVTNGLDSWIRESVPRRKSHDE